MTMYNKRGNLLNEKKSRMSNTLTRSVFSTAVSLALALAAPLTVYASTPNIDALKNSITGVGDIIAGFASPIFTLVLIIAGIAMMTGQQGRQWAKPTMLFGGIGYAVVSFAAVITNSFAAAFSA